MKGKARSVLLYLSSFVRSGLLEMDEQSFDRLAACELGVDPRWLLGKERFHQARDLGDRFPRLERRLHVLRERKCKGWPEAGFSARPQMQNGRGWEQVVILPIIHGLARDIESLRKLCSAQPSLWRI